MSTITYEGVRNIYVGDENNNAVKVWSVEEGWINKELYDRTVEKHNALAKHITARATEEAAK